MKNEAISTLQKNQPLILENWMKTQLSDDGLREDLMSNDELRKQSEEFLKAFLSNLNTDSIENSGSDDFDPVTELLSSISISRARNGFTAREVGLYIFGLKHVVMDILKNEIKDPHILFDQSRKITDLFDSFSVSTFETFIKGRQEVIFRQMDEINEISTPVIKIWEGIVALPIIGTLDSARTQVVMESLLQQIVETGSTIAILDISGVPAVDSLVAQHLMKTVSATRLMGAECIISGIRPEIAQTVVHLGIDLSSIITKATMASALKTAFSMRRLKLVSKD